MNPTRSSSPGDDHERIADGTDVDSATVARLEGQVQQLTKLLHLQDRERLMVSHDIHDGLVQYLVGTRFLLEATRAQLPPDLPHVAENLDRGLQQLAEAIVEVRRLITNLRPLAMEQELESALHDLIHMTRQQRCPTEIDFHYQPPAQPLSDLLATAVYRLVQEALTNVCRHSEAPQASVRIFPQDGNLRIEVADQGVGFDPASIPAERFGVRGMIERAQLFGGQTQIISAPGKGTQVSVSLPLG